MSVNTPPNNSSISAVREIGFDYGHRVVGQGGKCETLHGHRGKLQLHAIADSLNEVGMVIDFSVIKELAGNWIDTHWDHNVLVWEQDPNLPLILRMEGRKEPYITSFNPTAENMADFFLNDVCPLLFKDRGVLIYKVVLWETPNCFVEAVLHSK